MNTLWDQAKFLSKRFRSAQIQIRSAALAYHTLLAAVPLLGLVFLYLRRIGLSKKWFDLFRTHLLTQLNVPSDSRFMATFDKLTAAVPSRSWGWLGLLFVLYTTANLIDKFGKSLDAILDTSHEQHHIVKRSWFRLMARRVLVTLVLPFAMLGSLIVTHWLREGAWLRDVFHIKTGISMTAVPILWTVDVVALFLVYYFIPRSRVPWAQALKAALLAGPVLELTHYLFGVYSRHAVAIHRIYGIFVVVPMVVLWVQVAWMILLCGALFIHFSPKPEPSGSAR